MPPGLRLCPLVAETPQPWASIRDHLLALMRQVLKPKFRRLYDDPCLPYKRSGKQLLASYGQETRYSWSGSQATTIVTSMLHKEITLLSLMAVSVTTTFLACMPINSDCKSSAMAHTAIASLFGIKFPLII